MNVNQHYCTKCMKLHPLHYFLGEGCKHLAVECPKGHYHIPFKPGLNIPTRESKRLVRDKNKRLQPELL